MLQNWLMPQLNEDSNDYIFQQDGWPAQYKELQGYLNRKMPQMLIGRTGQKIKYYCIVSPVAGFNPFRLFLLVVSEGQSLCARNRRQIPDFRKLITAALALVERDMLTRVWKEMG